MEIQPHHSTWNFKNHKHTCAARSASPILRQKKGHHPLTHCEIPLDSKHILQCPKDVTMPTKNHNE